jgi:hypothetical protein
LRDSLTGRLQVNLAPGIFERHDFGVVVGASGY